MKSPTNPTSLMLVGVLFIYIILIPSTALEQSSALEQLNKLRDQQHDHPDLGMLNLGAETINFPWASQKDPHMHPSLPGFSSTPLKKEEIIMDNINPAANVQDISAINAQKQRDVIFKDSQEQDSDQEYPENSQEISVSGKENDESEGRSPNQERNEDSIGGRSPDNNKKHNAGNYLTIDVHDISVSAINTMQGGSSVATSNIIIEPVQIIVCPPEVGVKLA
ncbi:MAG: hypothetical protein A4E49_02002 [Methanosaeta sp. PtaU1.Bin112]|nr:MAG: hypothetical protein A4E49_02002 [Methanosaeta sp. PtaU1.Bin112]